MGTAAADLARYQYLPLNAFERVHPKKSPKIDVFGLVLVWLVARPVCVDLDLGPTPLFSSIQTPYPMAGVSGAISPLWGRTGEDLAVFKLARVGGKIAILVKPPIRLHQWHKLENAYTKKFFLIFYENSSQWTPRARVNGPPPFERRNMAPLANGPPPRNKKHGPGH